MDQICFWLGLYTSRIQDRNVTRKLFETLVSTPFRDQLFRHHEKHTENLLTVSTGDDIQDADGTHMAVANGTPPVGVIEVSRSFQS